eukprot:3507064-Amphidinium_carterae.1
MHTETIEFLREAKAKPRRESQRCFMQVSSQQDNRVVRDADQRSDCSILGNDTMDKGPGYPWRICSVYSSFGAEWNNGYTRARQHQLRVRTVHLYLHPLTVVPCTAYSKTPSSTACA